MEVRASKQEAWEAFQAANQDVYDKAIWTFGVRWADAIEALMGQGQSLGDAALESQQEVNEDKIPMSMVTGAMAILSEVWERGEAMRQWHNARVDDGEARWEIPAKYDALTKSAKKVVSEIVR